MLHWSNEEKDSPKDSLIEPQQQDITSSFMDEKERDDEKVEDMNSHGRVRGKEMEGGSRRDWQEETELEVTEVKCGRLKRSFVQQFVDAVADLSQRESVVLSIPVQLSQELPVGEMVENMINTCM